MDGTPAIVLTHADVRRMIKESAERAAEAAVAALKKDLHETPHDRTVRELRAYLLDPTTIANPRERWANSHHIRHLELSAKNKPKSIAWFHKFKHASGLADCFCRTSSQHGRLMEWTFEDIALAWKAHYLIP